jgi:hypothetical protein
MSGRLRPEHGAVAITVALLTVVLVGIMAFVVDLGLAYANKRTLQNGVDAAALALGQKVAQSADPALDCDEVAGEFDTAASETEAATWVKENVPAANGSTPSASLDDFAIECKTLNGVKQLVVRAEAEQSSPTFLGGIFGHEEIDIATAARVIVGPPSTVVGVRPFALCQAAANLISASPGTVLTFAFDNADAGCGYAPGNWGTMDLDGGSNGTPDLNEWVEDGYDGPISLSPPVYLPGDPGAPPPGALEDAMNDMVGVGPVVLPVYDDVDDSGSTSKFRITGFVTVDVCGWKLNNKSGNDSAESPSCFTAPSPVPDDYLQVKFAKFVPVGDLNLTCELANTSCDNGARVFKLAD